MGQKRERTFLKRISEKRDEFEAQARKPINRKNNKEELEYRYIKRIK